MLILDVALKNIAEHTKHQKDAQRNSAQKEVLNSSLLFFQSLIGEQNVDKNYQSLVQIRMRTTNRDSAFESPNLQNPDSIKCYVCRFQIKCPNHKWRFELLAAYS